MAAVEELEKILNCLMTIWDACEPEQQPAYPEHRMSHMLHLISKDITAFACEKLVTMISERGVTTAHSPEISPGNFLWELATPADVGDAESAVSDALNLLRTWRDRHVRQLMLDWMPGPQSISGHAWSGSAFMDQHLDSHIRRFEQVEYLLGLKRELIKALGREEQQVVQDAFLILATVDPFTVCTCVLIRLPCGNASITTWMQNKYLSIAWTYFRAQVLRKCADSVPVKCS